MRNGATFCAYDRVDAVGGPIRWVRDLAVHLHDRGWQLKMLIACPGGRSVSRLASECDAAGIQNNVLDTNAAPWLEDQIEWFLTRWSEYPTQCFVANVVLPAMYAARWIRQSGGYTIVVIHSDPSHDPFHGSVLSTFVSGDAAWKFDRIVAVSRVIADKVSAVDINGSQISTIACGASVPPLTVKGPESELKILYCGRLVQRQKRVREVTEAFLAASLIPGVCGSVCGDGPEKEWVIEALLGQERVRYLGSVPPTQMRSVMMQHHAIVLLSDYEGLSMAAVEAMACGLVPVLLDEPSSARELVEDGVTGFLVKDRGSSFLNAISYLRDAGTWKRLSIAARERVEKDYSHDVVFGRWATILTDVPGCDRIRLDTLPARVHLKGLHRPDLFVGYPLTRPSLSDVISQNLSGTAARLASAIRPGVRAKALLRRFRQGIWPS